MTLLNNRCLLSYFEKQLPIEYVLPVTLYFALLSTFIKSLGRGACHSESGGQRTTCRESVLLFYQWGLGFKLRL